MSSRQRIIVRVLIGLLLLGLVGCASSNGVAVESAVVVATEEDALQRITRTRPPASPTPTMIILPPTATPTLLPPATATLAPTATPSATPLPPTATPTRTPSCEEIVPATDSLLTLVTRDYGLSATYAPTDLVDLSAHFSAEITLGFPTKVREQLIPPLAAIVADMQAAGLRPTIISGYRDHVSQAIAWEKWTTRYPEYGYLLSARPGHSEHQLGTTVDFGSYEIDNEFHTNFQNTSEGQWLLQYAHRYGFTLSYPADAFEETGFYYEPWHYRYVGEALATELWQSNQSLTAYLLANSPDPCVAQ